MSWRARVAVGPPARRRVPLSHAQTLASQDVGLGLSIARHAAWCHGRRDVAAVSSSTVRRSFRIKARFRKPAL